MENFIETIKLKDGKFKFAVILSHTGELLKEISTYRPNAFIAGIVSDNKLVNKYILKMYCTIHRNLSLWRVTKN